MGKIKPIVYCCIALCLGLLFAQCTTAEESKGTWIWRVASSDPNAKAEWVFVADMVRSRQGAVDDSPVIVGEEQRARHHHEDHVVLEPVQKEPVQYSSNKSGERRVFRGRFRGRLFGGRAGGFCGIFGCN